MTSSPRGIIRGAAVDGVLFCTPVGTNSIDPVAKQEKDNLKALEDFWLQKGIEEGKKAGFEEGFAAGQEEGYRKGLQEGEAKGLGEGHATGKQEGLLEGKESVIKEVCDLMALLQHLSEQLKQAQSHFYEQGKAELIAFSIKVCEQVLRQQLEEFGLFKKVIQQVVQGALPLIKECPVEIFLSPQDHKQVEAVGLRDELLKELQGDATSLRILVDPACVQGDCRLETPFGLVNFDLKRLLSDIERKVLEVHSGEQEEVAELAVEPEQDVEVESVSFSADQEKGENCGTEPQE